MVTFSRQFSVTTTAALRAQECRSCVSDLICGRIRMPSNFNLFVCHSQKQQNQPLKSMNEIGFVTSVYFAEIQHCKFLIVANGTVVLHT